MKNLILIFTILLLSCSNDDNKPQENPLKGTWKLIETYSSDGGSNPQWTSVENGYTYTFNSNGTYSSTRFSECSTGEYTITDSTATLYDISGNPVKSKTPFDGKMNVEKVKAGLYILVVTTNGVKNSFRIIIN